MSQEGTTNQSRIAIVGIIIEKPEAAAGVNETLTENAGHIIGRMGIPYKDKGVNVISVVVDATTDVINSMAGKLGRIDGVSAKAVYSKAN